MSREFRTQRAGAAGCNRVARYSAITVLALSISPVFASEAKSSAVERRIERIENNLLPPVLVMGERVPPTRLADRMQALHVPGVSIAVINDGQIEWARGYGVSKVGGSAVTPETLFQAASISKPVSALAVMQVVQDGKLDLDADVNLYLKSWKLPPSELIGHEKVTVRRLLSHTAGTTVHGFRGYASGEAVPTLRDVLDGQAPANSASIRVSVLPGKEWRYSGGGYVVLQQMLEDVTGAPFSDMLHDRVLEPLGMKHSTFQQPLPAALLHGAATPYRSDGSAVVGGAHTYPELAAAGLWTTPSDLARYAIGLQHALAGEPRSILSSAVARRMVTRQSGRHGLGPMVGGDADRSYFMHGGANEGFRCTLVAYFAGDGAVIMTNSEAGGELTQQVLRTIAREYEWPDFAPPMRTLTAVNPKTFDRYAGAYQLAPGLVITVWREGNRRYSRVKGGPIGELFPSSEREYFQRALDARLEFVPDAGSEGMTMMLYENGEPRKGTRLNAVAGRSLIDEAVAVGKRVREQRPLPGSDVKLRKLIADLASGSVDYDGMTADFAAQTREYLAPWQTEIASLGAVVAMRFQRVSPEGADVYDIDFAKGAATAGIALEPDERIASAWVQRK